MEVGELVSVAVAVALEVAVGEGGGSYVADTVAVPEEEPVRLGLGAALLLALAEGVP